MTATDENLKYGIELEADRMVNSRVEKQLLDTEMTVVRSEFEMRRELARGHPDAARAGSALRVAQLRQAADRQSQRHRKCADQPAGGVLPEVLPARQRAADRRRQVR